MRMRSLASLIGLNFADKRDLAKNTDSICAGLNFEDEKFYKAAGARQNLTPLQNSDISNFVFYLAILGCVRGLRRDVASKFKP